MKWKGKEKKEMGGGGRSNELAAAMETGARQIRNSSPHEEAE